MPPACSTSNPIARTSSRPSTWWTSRCRRCRSSACARAATRSTASTKRCAEPVTRRRAARLAGYAALTLYFTWPLLASGARLGIVDWDALLFQHASVMRSVYEYGQPPFWNPWYCGGHVLWQNPQAPLVSAVYLLAPFMPLAAAMKIVVAAHYLAGFAGMHRLVTRALRVTWLPAVLFLSSLFVLAGAPALHIIVGHTPFLPYFYLPWLLLFWIRAIETARVAFVLGAAAILA